MAKKEPPPSPLADVDSIGWFGHAIPAVLGFLSLIAAIFSFRGGIQPSLGVALIVVGLLLPLLAWMSLLNRARGAWSFLIALCVVLGIMTLFGAPKVRNLVGIALPVALIIPALLGSAAFCLSLLDHRYKN